MADIRLDEEQLAHTLRGVRKYLQDDMGLNYDEGLLCARLLVIIMEQTAKLADKDRDTRHTILHGLMQNEIDRAKELPSVRETAN